MDSIIPSCSQVYAFHSLFHDYAILQSRDCREIVEELSLEPLPGYISYPPKPLQIPGQT